MRPAHRNRFRWLPAGTRAAQRGLRAGLVLGGVLALSWPGGAQPAASTPETPEAPAPAPAVQLDDLLKLPDSGSYDVERRGGATRGEWRERFVNVQSDLDEERSALAQAKQELEKVAGNADAWKLTPPGATAGNDAPLDYRLRNQIRQHTAEVERLEKQLRDLQVEANLAGVPDSWIGE